LVEGSIVDWEILHGGEGGDVEQWLEPQNNLLVCDCFLASTYLLFIHSFIVDLYSS